MPLHHFLSLTLVYLLLANRKSCLGDSRVTQIYTSVRKNVTLSCDDGMYMNVVTSWVLPNGHTLKADDTVSRIRKEWDSNSLQFKLQLSDVTINDEGLYSCVVEKKENGSTSIELRQFQLHVVELPSKPYQCHVLQADSAKEFLCSSDSTRSDDVIYHLMHKRHQLDDVLVTKSSNPEFALNHMTVKAVSDGPANGDRKILLYMCAVKRTFPDAHSCGQTVAVILGDAAEKGNDRGTSTVPVVVPVVAVLAVSLLLILLVGTVCIYRHKITRADHPKQDSALVDPHSIITQPQLSDLMSSHSPLKVQGPIRDSSQRVRQVRADSPTTNLRNTPLRLSTSLESSPTVARYKRDEARNNMANHGSVKRPSEEYCRAHQFSPRNGTATCPPPSSQKSFSTSSFHSAGGTSEISFNQADLSYQADLSSYSEYGKEHKEKGTNFNNGWPARQRNYCNNLNAHNPFVNDESLAFARNSDTLSRGSSFYKLFKPSNVKVSDNKSRVDGDNASRFRHRYGSLERQGDIGHADSVGTLKEYPPYENIDGQVMKYEKSQASLRDELFQKEARHFKVPERISSNDGFSYHRLPLRSSRENEHPEDSSSFQATYNVTKATNTDKNKPAPSALETEHVLTHKGCFSNVSKKMERHDDYHYVKYPIPAGRHHKYDKQEADGGVYSQNSENIGHNVKSKNYDRIPMWYTQHPPHFPNFHVCERHFRRNINAATITNNDKNHNLDDVQSLKTSSALSKSLTSLDFIVTESSNKFSSANRVDLQDSEPYTVSERRLTVVPPDLDLPPKLPKKTRISSPFLMTSSRRMKRRPPSDDYVYHVPCNVPRDPPEKEKDTETEKGVHNDVHGRKDPFDIKCDQANNTVLLPLRTSSIASVSSSSVNSEELNANISFTSADCNSILTSNLKFSNSRKPSAECSEERVNSDNALQHKPSKNVGGGRYFTEKKAHHDSSPLAVAESSSVWPEEHKCYDSTNTSLCNDVFRDDVSDKFARNSFICEISASRDDANISKDSPKASASRLKANLKDTSTYDTNLEEDTYSRSGRPLYVYIPGRHKKRRAKSRSVSGSVSSDHSSASSNLGSSKASLEKLVSSADVTPSKQKPFAPREDKITKLMDVPEQNALRQYRGWGCGVKMDSSRHNVGQKGMTTTSGEVWSPRSRLVTRNIGHSRSAEILESEERSKYQSFEPILSKRRKSRSLSSLHRGNEEELRLGLFPRYWRYGELLRPHVREEDIGGVSHNY